MRVPAQDQGADADGAAEAADGDLKIVADLSKKVATAYVVSKKSAKLSDSGTSRRTRRAQARGELAESTGDLSDGE